ncbi:MAG: hypothetical protein ACREPM_03570 [Gemmatimonadaceae bacterium]
MGSLGPRWLLRMLPWVDVEAGLFRLNRVRIVGSEFQRVETRVGGERALLLPENLRAIPLFRSPGVDVLSELLPSLLLVLSRTAEQSLIGTCPSATAPGGEQDRGAHRVRANDHQ